jgi:ABC-type multidrug transport system fused ATPase/permease subunit
MSITDYGFFPFLSSEETCHKSMSFRISLFRVLSESAAISFFVLLWNIYKPAKQDGWIRYICILLSIYFIIFSGIRSAILTLLIISPLLIFQLLRLKKINLRALFYFICSLFLIGYILIQSSLLSVNSVRNLVANRVRNLVANQLLRIDSCSAIAVLQPTTPRILEQKSDLVFIKSIGDFLGVKNSSRPWLEQTINRHCSAGYQLKLFLDHPLIGNSVARPNSIEEEARVGCSHEAIQRFCDACVLATYWLSKGGIAGVIFIIIYFATFALALWRKSMLGVTTLFSFGLFLQGWGVMFMPYNFTFYMLMSVIPIISFTKRRS